MSSGNLEQSRKRLNYVWRKVNQDQRFEERIRGREPAAKSTRYTDEETFILYATQASCETGCYDYEGEDGI